MGRVKVPGGKGEDALLPNMKKLDFCDIFYGTGVASNYVAIDAAKITDGNTPGDYFSINLSALAQFDDAKKGTSFIVVSTLAVCYNTRDGISLPGYNYGISTIANRDGWGSNAVSLAQGAYDAVYDKNTNQLRIHIGPYKVIPESINIIMVRVERGPTT